MRVLKICISYNIYIFKIYLGFLSLNRLQTVIFQIYELRLLCKPKDQRLVLVIRSLMLTFQIVISCRAIGAGWE